MTWRILFFILLLACPFRHAVAAYPQRDWLSIFPPLLTADARARIDRERQFLLRHKGYLEARLRTAQPLMRHIAAEVDARGLPSIVILLPFIESGYRLDVVSSAGAAGLWQLMPATAQRFTVPMQPGFDGRYSLPLATDAALSYLSWLNQQFNGDWLLTLAAYNAGEGRIQRAQQEQAQMSYWRLLLADETLRYVPRLLALAELIQYPEQHGLSLPDWQSGANLMLRRLTGPLSLAQLAAQEGWDERQLAALNPAFRQPALPAGSSQLLLLPSQHTQPRRDTPATTLKPGLDLSAIAPLLPLDGLQDPLLLHGSHGLDMQGRPAPTATISQDPLGVSKAGPRVIP